MLVFFVIMMRLECLCSMWHDEDKEDNKNIHSYPMPRLCIYLFWCMRNVLLLLVGNNNIYSVPTRSFTPHPFNNNCKYVHSRVARFCTNFKISLAHLGLITSFSPKNIWFYPKDHFFKTNIRKSYIYIKQFNNLTIVIHTVLTILETNLNLKHIEHIF